MVKMQVKLLGSCILLEESDGRVNASRLSIIANIKSWFDGKRSKLLDQRKGKVKR
jgi:hypothetical protein